MDGRKPAREGSRASLLEKPAVWRSIAAGAGLPKKARLAWQPQEWKTDVQPCSVPAGSCRSPSAAACARWPSTTKCAAFSMSSKAPGIIARAKTRAQIL